VRQIIYPNLKLAKHGIIKVRKKKKQIKWQNKTEQILFESIFRLTF